MLGRTIDAERKRSQRGHDDERHRASPMELTRLTHTHDLDLLNGRRRAHPNRGVTDNR
jgi:hypothetical protein